MINWTDIFSIVKIAVTLLVSSFLWFLPLVMLLGNKKIALRVTIPVSISIQIIFGYIFYSLGWTKQYPQIYFILGLAINLFAIYGLSRLGRLKDILKCNLKKTFFWVCLALFIMVIVSRFYDAFTSIAPGEIDTYNHTRFLLDLTKQGILSFPQYAPGFHLFIYPLTFISKLSEIYRFTGPIIGVVSSLSIYLILKDDFKRSSSKIVLLALLCFPVFNQLFLQQIGFFSTSLSFIFFPAFLYMIMTDGFEFGRFKLLTIYGLAMIAFSLTIPYLFVQYLPALGIYSIVIWIINKRLDKAYLKQLTAIIIITLFGFIIAFGHVYLQTKVLKRANSFPPMQLTHFEDGNLVSLNNYAALETNSNEDQKETFLTSLQKNEFFVSYITPMYNIARDVFSVKIIWASIDILSIGAYVWFLVSLFLIGYACKLKDKPLLLISVFTIVFGLATQLGIIEINTYRGRAGWYLMLLSLIGATYIYDRFMSKYFEKKWFLIPALIVISLLTLLKPPIYYRAYYTEEYKVIKKAATSSPNSTISIIAEDKQLSLVSDKIAMNSLSLVNVQTPCTADRCFIVLQNKFLKIDPVLSQQAVAGDSNFDNFNSTQKQLEQQYDDLSSSIKATKEFKDYRLYWNNENVSVYEYSKAKS